MTTRAILLAIAEGERASWHMTQDKGKQPNALYVFACQAAAIWGSLRTTLDNIGYPVDLPSMEAYMNTLRAACLAYAHGKMANPFVPPSPPPSVATPVKMPVASVSAGPAPVATLPDEELNAIDYLMTLTPAEIGALPPEQRGPILEVRKVLAGVAAKK